MQERMAELAALAGTLQRVEAELTSDLTEDPCGDGCVCQTAGTAAPAPIACSLNAEEIPDRIRDWKALIAEAISHDDIDGGARLIFRPGHDLAARVAALAAAEQSCCAFFDFTVRITADATVLEARAPGGGQEMITALLDDAVG